ncbi:MULTISPECIES: AimR family lysis-lysogeny pheromone receptor [Bacillus cereus group]|uniref:AimR family lysis-lysogeny pheromone receptor n=1 Tax=Bacillus cereus group TaxID=86661 RepID=UPI000BF7116B|nr:AimR family lysis-lysogeny pheromone receptor [Bacillus thuringiensis]MED2874034.1 AimR family lysis-lysogeny pheromone receptor [Bacillus thuringiensis]PEZ32017.1 hypothetical protein CN346_19220 [Bacillus thuringiensis]PFV83970.1 hypothetical protein COL06_25515 [Bacillus thuringiensis]
MQTVLEKIQDDLFAKGITNKSLAKYLSVSPSGVSDFFKGKREMSFSYFSKTLALLYEEEHEKRRRFIHRYLNITKKHESLREALEYTAIRGEFEMLEHIFLKELQSTNATNREWAAMYELFYKRNAERIDGKQFLSLVEEKRKKVKTLEMQVMSDILLCYALHDIGNYRLLKNYISAANLKIEKIKNKFIQHCFRIRMREWLCVINLLSGNLIEARNKCEELLFICREDPQYTLQRANAYCNLGESYIFEDYNLSKGFLEKSLVCLGDTFNHGLKVKRQLIEYTLIFLKIHHSKDIENIDIKIHPAEKAYLCIKQGDKESAIEILEGLEKDKNLSAFQLCYMGLAKDDLNLIKKSLELFEEIGNVFYAKLPKSYLGLI